MSMMNKSPHILDQDQLHKIVGKSLALEALERKIYHSAIDRNVMEKLFREEIIRQLKKSNNRRYYLHRKVREQGLKVSVKDKTVYVPFHIGGLSKQVKALRDEYHYSIQTEII